MAKKVNRKVERHRRRRNGLAGSSSLALPAAAILGSGIGAVVARALGIDPTPALVGVAAGAMRPFADRLLSNESERQRTREWLATLQVRLVRLSVQALDEGEPRRAEKVAALAIETLELVRGFMETLRAESEPRQPDTGERPTPQRFDVAAIKPQQ